MKIKALSFRENSKHGPVPDTVTAELTSREVLFLAVCLGGLSEVSSDNILRGFNRESSGMYEALANAVVNRFYDDGVADMLLAEREAPVVPGE